MWTSDTMVQQGRPPLEIKELPEEDEARLEKLFSKLDTDGNGKIDIHDLSVALKELAPHINRSYAEKFLAKTGKDAGDVTLSEFIHYVREHEKNLRLQFSHLDKNKDGKVDLEELISAFADLGIAIGRSEATNLLKRMDQDGSLNISYDEWRDYLLLAPATDIHALIHFWRHSTVEKYNQQKENDDFCSSSTLKKLIIEEDSGNARPTLTSTSSHPAKIDIATQVTVKMMDKRTFMHKPIEKILPVCSNISSSATSSQETHKADLSQISMYTVPSTESLSSREKEQENKYEEQILDL